MKFILCILSFLFCFVVVSAQDLGNMGKQKPFTISGNIGGSTSFYHSNEPVATRPAFSWNTFGNFTPTVYGVSLPFSFVVNQYSKSYSQPFTQFGLSPTYKWAKLHLGYRSMQFSPMTFDGQSFRGVGLELTPKLFRFAAFYGKLNRKVNEDTTSGRYMLPQFSRKAAGVKIGVGNAANYFDLIWFHAKDDSASANIINKGNYRPQENTVLGSSFKVTLKRKIIFNTDIAISGLTQDLSLAPANDSANTGLLKLMDGFVPYNSSTVANWAGQSNLQFILNGYVTSLGYRRVQPGFKSLGTPYMLNDISLVNWMNNFYLAKGRLNITALVASQHNNLDKKLTNELHTFTSNFSINAILSTRFNLNTSYSGYHLQQKDGTLHLKDSARLNQDIHQFNITPSYTVSNTVHSNTVSGNISYMLLDDKNPATSPFTNSNNLALSLNYTLGLIKQASSFTLSGLFSKYTQDTNFYKTYGATISSSAQVLKNKQLGLQGSAGYLINRSSYGNAQSNLTFSGNISYRVKHHSFNAYANYIYTPYNPINNVINQQVPQAVATKNTGGGLSYNYSF